MEHTFPVLLNFFFFITDAPYCLKSVYFKDNFFFKNSAKPVFLFANLKRREPIVVTLFNVPFCIEG